MANIIAFRIPPARNSQRPAATAGHQAEVLLFTGVRYEHALADPEPTKPRSGRNGRRKQKSGT